MFSLQLQLQALRLQVQRPKRERNAHERPEASTPVQEEGQPGPGGGHQADGATTEDGRRESQADNGQRGFLAPTRRGIPADGGGRESLLAGAQNVRR